MRFTRQDSHKKKRLNKKWRKPRGRQSKMRLRRDGRKVVTPGYGSPKEEKGKHHKGLEIVRVQKMEDIDKIDPKKQGAIVSGRLGLRRKLPLLEALMEKKITVLNIPDPKAYVTSKKEALKSRKEDKKEEKEEKEETKEKKEEKESRTN